MCKYLHDIVGVDFLIPNHGGNTPLTHAVAFGRLEVVEWLRNEVIPLSSSEDDMDDTMAAQLAQDFAVWKQDDERRTRILELFQDDYWDEPDAPLGTEDVLQEEF